MIASHMSAAPRKPAIAVALEAELPFQPAIRPRALTLSGLESLVAAIT
jgi:hypothetical protein